MKKTLKRDRIIKAYLAGAKAMTVYPKYAEVARKTKTSEAYVSLIIKEYKRQRKAFGF